MRGWFAFVVVAGLCMAGCSSAEEGPPASSPTAPQPTSSPSEEPAAVDVDGRILFARGPDGGTEEYFTIAADGTVNAIFEAEQCAPCVFLSPDGTRVMLPSFTDGRLTTATVAADGTDQILVPLPNDTLNLAPGAWSPDGGRLALFGWDETEPSSSGVYVASAADGSHLEQITVGEGQEPIEWSPDGERLLVFAETGSVGPVTHAGKLFVVNVDGTGLRELTPRGMLVGRVRQAGRAAGWSPDGRQVVFAAFDARADEIRSAVFVVDAGAGDSRRVTEWGAVIAAASWSPSGEWIAYSDLSEPTISIVSPEGGEPTALVPPGDASCCPVWAPDGTRLLFQRGTGGASNLWIVNLAGVILGQVTDEPANYFGYWWSDSP